MLKPETRNPKPPLILDPVMVAKGGAALLDPDAVDALKMLLFPLATLITPNIPEAEVLTGLSIRTVADMEQAARVLLRTGAKAVLVKGGHLEEAEINDVLVTNDAIEIFRRPRIATRHTHGTGCTLASAIATGIAQGKTLKESVRYARDYVQEAILTAPGFGQGNGPLNHLQSF